MLRNIRWRGWIVGLGVLWGASGCGPGDSRWSDPPLGAGAGSSVVAQERRLPLPDGGGSVESRVWEPRGAAPRVGVVFVSGVDGGFVEPVDGVYARLAERLGGKGVPSVFVKYRFPGHLAESVQDALAGAAYLRGLGTGRLAFVGWSFGGAVMIHSAARTPEAVTVLGFAPQARDTEPVAGFARQSILLFHSRADENVPFVSSEQILEAAPEGVRGRLVALDGYDHLLTGAADAVDAEAGAWLERELGI